VRCNGGVDEFSLPGYDVEELVGFGGSGEVWRARDSSTGEVVALKRLRGDTSTTLSAEQLQREAVLLATVRHDHIVALRSVVARAAVWQRCSGRAIGCLPARLSRSACPWLRRCLTFTREV
jgi:serine/threonine protein kinase